MLEIVFIDSSIIYVEHSQWHYICGYILQAVRINLSSGSKLLMVFMDFTFYVNSNKNIQWYQIFDQLHGVLESKRFNSCVT